MYSISDLDKKSPEELHTIAKELGIKRAETMDKEALVYKILDEQAVQSKETPRLRRKRISKKEEVKPSEESSMSITPEGNRDNDSELRNNDASKDEKSELKPKEETVSQPTKRKRGRQERIPLMQNKFLL